MADGKQRQNNNAKIATPKIGSGGGAAATGSGATTPGSAGGKMDELDVALSKAIGARVKVTTSHTTLEGTLFTSCPITNLIAINTSPAPPSTSSNVHALVGEYHIIPVSHISNFQVLALPAATDRVEGSGSVGFDGALPSISRADHNALRAREEAAVRKIKERDASRPKGVSKTGYDVYDAVARTLPAYWAADGTIVVNDTVRINKPYGVADVQAAATHAGSMQQVRKILEAHYAKQKAKAPQQQAAASNRNSVAMPLAPRKGG